MSRKVSIVWAGKRLEIRRVLVGPKAEHCEEIIREAKALGLMVITPQEMVMPDLFSSRTVPEPQDLWVGVSPAGGWNRLEGKCGEARTAEGEIVLSRLRAASVVEE